MSRTIFADPQALAAAAAQAFATLALEAIAARGAFYVALAGGSTPKIIYEQLATLELPWAQIQLFFGDERCVPPADPRSNYAMVSAALLTKVQIPSRNIHRIQTELDIAQAIRLYQAELEPVVFDLVHLGIGSDGHTASLFPATLNLESAETVRQTFPTLGLEPQVPRISLGLGVINAARVKQFFVTGANKRPILERLGNGEDLPAARVLDAQWWLDEAAIE